uniref:NADH-quinone oxidoreductase subunit C n=1 Tax=Fervidicoccus fontis TaxID=683846 RepID=A0A7C1DZD9_9CREN
MEELGNECSLQPIGPSRYQCIIEKEKIIGLAHRLSAMETSFLLLTATDYPDEKKFELTYVFWNHASRSLIIIKTHVSRDSLQIDTISDLFPGATYSEAEAYDLVGVEFIGNPHIKRGIFAPTDVVEKGIFPLRKDSGV